MLDSLFCSTARVGRAGKRWLLAALCALCTPAVADVTLPRLLSDGAILQRDQPVLIWGWADEGETVSVTFAGLTQTTQARKGRWQVEFPAQAAGTEHRLLVQGNNRLERQHLVMGDLWLASGQSNIELPIRRVTQRYPDLVANTHLPLVREFNVPLLYNAHGPEEDYRAGAWAHAVPESLPEFSAVGFFYAQKLFNATGVPQGIIRVPVGGSPIEAWLKADTLKKYPHYLEKLTAMQAPGVLEARIAKDKAASDAWYTNLSQQDQGLKDNWLNAPFVAAQWQSITLPARFKDQGQQLEQGAAWLTKTVNLSAAQAALGATLWLGCIVDGDQTYVNGVEVGATGYQYPPRIYRLPANLLRAGENRITVRVTSYSGAPAFVEDKTYALRFDNQESVDLSGAWWYREAARVAPQQPGLTPHYLPGSLYNAKIAPALKLPVRGLLWYQGESNTGRTVADNLARLPSVHCAHQSCSGSVDEYRYLLTDLIHQTRQDFNNPDLPVYFVQLANFLKPQSAPRESAWAATREAQRQVAQLPNTGMAVIIDTGEWNDIHPLNKQDVGERLARLALKHTYGQKIEAQGPSLRAIKRRGASLELRFDHAAKGLVVKGERLGAIAIAGADKQFVWADAKVRGDRIRVSAAGIATPKWVRYAWADNPADANLYNAAQLPASPFEAYVE